MDVEIAKDINKLEVADFVKTCIMVFSGSSSLQRNFPFFIDSSEEFIFKHYFLMNSSDFIVTFIFSLGFLPNKTLIEKLSQDFV